MYCDEWLSGEKEFRKKQLRHALFREFVSDFSEISGFSPDLQKRLTEKRPFHALRVLSHRADENTEKLLVEIDDGKRVEAVLMKHNGRNTVCVSCQVGCAANCSFCSTGKMGFSKHLCQREIVEQVLLFARLLKQRWREKYPKKKWNSNTVDLAFRIRNVVFMGMGEPLQNFSHVAEAISIFADEKGLNLGARHITVSTVGIAKNISKLLDLPRLPNLAVSLHAATDQLRNTIVPTNLGFPLTDLFTALDIFVKKTGRRIFYEWTVLKGVNDTKEQMIALGELLRGRNAHVNFIPWNPGPSRILYEKPTIADVRHMQTFLEKEYGVPSTIRAVYGDEMGGACGQLAARE